MKYLFKTVMMIVLLIGSSCQGKEERPDHSLVFELSSKELSFTSEAGQQFITVISDEEFTAQSSSSWCVASVSKNKIDNLRITVTANEIEEERTADVALICNGSVAGKVTVKQRAYQPPLPPPPPPDDLPTSAALPAGMRQVWADEFNVDALDTQKWCTDFYSTFNFVRRNDGIFVHKNPGEYPQPGMRFTGRSIVLLVNNYVPAEPYANDGAHCSSIQTYDWKTDKFLFENSLGGFIEARIKRSRSWKRHVSAAFWLDSPGPDARYFVEKGNYAHGVAGIRPRGQVFEIDLCEYMNTEIALHGNVSPGGWEESMIGHYPLRGDEYEDMWEVHSMLWSPAGLKFYLDGELIQECWEPHYINSSNHSMNILLTIQSMPTVTATLEVDYIRFYQWELEDSNELPNSGFEYHAGLFPWEGAGTVTAQAARTGKSGVELAPGQSIAQYVYLDHSHPYSMKFWSKGTEGTIDAAIENITQVSGVAENRFGAEFETSTNFRQNEIRFSTNPEYGNHKRTVKITFKNTGSSAIEIDDINVVKE